MHIMFTRHAVIALVALSQLGPGRPKLDEAELVKVLEPHYQEQAARYEFFLDAAHQKKLDFIGKPVMRWTAEGNSGAVWVWTRSGRPEVVGCLGAYVNQFGKLEGFHEFHSLTLKPLQKVEIGTIRTWESSKPGVHPVLLEGVEEPASTDRLRLVQMRNLAREFTAQMKTDKQTHVLRLTPAPLFRYQSTDPEVLDGALFSYLQDNGTDPELLLLVEARKTTGGMRWHYAPVRFSWREVWLTRDDKEVWRVPEHNEYWTSKILRDNYVTCAMGELDMDKLTPKRAATPAENK
jgi:hypothetical protein